MKKSTIVTFFSILTLGGVMFNFLLKSEASQAQDKIGQHLTKINYENTDWKSKDKAYWQSVMTPLQYRVTREAGTEKAFSGKYNEDKREGHFHCSACGQKLFESTTKFDSGTGWPSFYDAIKDAVKLNEDRSWGMRRVEVVCSRCDSHLGHVFDDGPRPTGQRYCMNSASLIHSEDLK